MNATVLYVVPALDPADAIDQVDNWLSCYLDWQGNARQGEDYDIEAAQLRSSDAIDPDTGEPLYEVRVPITYTEQTSSTLLGFIDDHESAA